MCIHLKHNDAIKVTVIILTPSEAFCDLSNSSDSLSCENSRYDHTANLFSSSGQV